MKRQLLFLKYLLMNYDVFTVSIKDLKEIRQESIIEDLGEKIILIRELERAQKDPFYANTFVIDKEEREIKLRERLIELKKILPSLKKEVLSYLKKKKEKNIQPIPYAKILIDAYLEYGNLSEEEQDLFTSYKECKKQKVYE